MRSSSKALRVAATGAASVALGATALAFAPLAGAATQATTPMCTTAQLAGSLGGSDAGAGQIYQDVVLTNRSTATCHLTGYPGVSVLDSHGKQIGAPATHDPRSYSAVVLAPGASAGTTIHTGNRMTDNPGECRPVSSSVRVYPPGNRTSLVIPAKLTICDIFTVIPLTAAGTGTGTPSAAPSSASTATPSAAPTSQVSAVPSGAPATGEAPTSSGGGSAGVLAAGAGALLVVGGTGVAVVRSRRSRARG